ncbi:MAG: FHA domain-containing protein [Parabacteroides sp.]|nr:FHA domain-containing protein [Parabacteroides sp.]MDD6081035.1 FHA domain-containing protein [bacterium]MCI7008620.1 FHA domain-containing protein [Parabacteroides sp.]MCI7782650.1 FHA domain-containing protein [Parabacteroides sp.]MDD7062279.1 FHA domain-containing protein [bacterium]
MIAIKCPHCLIGLKVDEGKIPLGLTSFKCPKCKGAIPISLLSAGNREGNNDPDTILIHPLKTDIGRLTVLPDENTPEQHLSLHEGTLIIGRKSNASKASLPIQTGDRTMSREHAVIEVKKDGKGGYKHYLSDNNSKNHTLYNNNYLGDGEVVVLNDNDEIILGHTVIRFND